MADAAGPRAPRTTRDFYLVKSVVRAAECLWAFQNPGEALRLRDVMDRTGFSKAMSFRLLYTLHHCGFLERAEGNRFRLTGAVRRRKRYRIGYAAPGGPDDSFPAAVLAGLRDAAEREQVELVVVDNRYSPKVAMRTAEQLVREAVDLVVEFQTDESAAPAIAATYIDAGIPFIAIDIPHPGGTYFGANNYDAGLLAGRHLGRFARARWNGRVDEILALEIARAGALPRARTRGMLAGIKEIVREAESCPLVALDGDGQFKSALEAVRKHLRRSKARHILVGAANDPSALGAARAFEEAGRAASCAVVGQNAEPDARAELRRARTPLIASVGYFPEKYGEGIIRVALDILAHRAVPPAVFVRHQIVTRENVDHLYPNDALMGLAPPARF